MTSNGIMNAIKRAVSPKTQRIAPSRGMQSPVSVSRTPLTEFICTRLHGENLKLFALMFAEAIKNDRHAKVILFENVYKFLGYDLYHHAVRQLKKLFPEMQSTRLDKLTTSGEVAKNTPGPSKDSYLISVRQFETMMLAAKTDEGARAREMMLDVKDAVQDYMKLEMEASAARAEEQTSKLAIEEAKRLELETTHADLHATLNAERERRSAMKALRDAEDEPRQTAYLMESGVHRSYVKIGKTGDEGGEKRKKELQTGNPEKIRVLFEMKCVDSRLVEKNLHHVFRWYKRRGEWYEIDKERAVYAMQLMANLLDGLRQVEHDDEDIVEACQKVLRVHKLEVPSSSDTETDDYTYECPESVTNSSQQLMADDNPFAIFVSRNVIRSDAKNAHFTTKEAKDAWKMQESEYGKTPKEEEIRQQFAMLLRVPCLKRFFVPAEFASEYTVKSGDYKPCSVFCGFSLTT
jgi:hypothetical protein